MFGINNSTRENAVGTNPGYLPSANPGMQGGNTYTATSSDPTIQDYENVFGPSARDIKQDLQRFKRHGRWHLPDVLKGPNPWLTDRIDGLITDTTDSPFTTKILPYKFKEDPDAKMKWNVWTFDEGMASRVPYETAARTLTQSKRSFSGYMVRQGMAISLEHNFMMSPTGREDFKNQLNQLIGSIQYTNDLDVHMALILAPSYEKHMRERYYSNDKSPSQVCREFVDLFGMAQKNTNALDILIEEAKAILKTWGSPMPDFMLCNSKLTFQLTMTPEKTNYITQGYDGVKRLKNGPDIASYRGLSVIHSRSFSMETGQHPRDILRRRVRTAEYYRIVPHKDNHKREFEFYNEERDTWFTLSFKDLLRMARYEPNGDTTSPNHQLIDSAHDSIRSTVENAKMATLDAFFPSRPVVKKSDNMLSDDDFTGLLDVVLAGFNAIAAKRPSRISWYRSSVTPSTSAYNEQSRGWGEVFYPFDLGIKQIRPRGIPGLELVQQKSNEEDYGDSRSYLKRTGPFSLGTIPRINSQIEDSLFEQFKSVKLNHPFQVGVVCTYPHANWYMAFTFWITVFKRYGFPIDYLRPVNPAVMPATRTIPEMNAALATGLTMREDFPPDNEVDLSCQMLKQFGTGGSVNDECNMGRDNDNALLEAVGDIWTGEDIYQNQFTDDGDVRKIGGFMALVPVLTWEILKYVVPYYETPHGVVSGLSILQDSISTHGTAIGNALMRAFNATMGAVTFGRIDGRVGLTLELLREWDTVVRPIFEAFRIHDANNAADALASHGINTWPMGVSTISHFLHPATSRDINEAVRAGYGMFEGSFGHVNHQYLTSIQTIARHPWVSKNFDDLTAANNQTAQECFSDFLRELRRRLFQDRRLSSQLLLRTKIDDLMRGSPARGAVPAIYPPAARPRNPEERRDVYLSDVNTLQPDIIKILDSVARHTQSANVSAVADDGLSRITVRYDDLYRSMPDIPLPVVPSQSASVVQSSQRSKQGLEDIEIVIVRPNIEHTMLGIILGLGGDALGNTLWGQTELSVYDDSMYGIWGMSYKYHERAIVFNEKNLIRMWDVAYDGYNGGKDDTYVDWTQPGGTNGCETFKNMTMDVSQNYHGPSMMVMAFAHDKQDQGDDGQRLYDRHFRRNWPSPIVYHDSWTPGQRVADAITLPVDCDNIHVISVEEFRVFNNPLYMAYQDYKTFMPPFNELHKQRKSAGQSSVDSETPTDSLAFQGTMRIKEDGRLMQEILGSGHHGPDYIGIASVRAGKGQKVSGQAPTLHRLI
jgi:hypothetical protein